MRLSCLPWVLAAAVLMSGASARAQDEKTVELGDDDFEVLDDGEEASADGSTAGDTQRDRSVVRTLGRMHPPLVHFAVAWAVLVLPFAVARARKPLLGRVDLWLLAGSTAAAAAAVATGLVHAPDVMGRPGIEELVELHEHTGIAVLALQAAALALRIVSERVKHGALTASYLVLLAAVTVLVLVVGHLGGSITFGEGFLF